MSKPNPNMGTLYLIHFAAPVCDQYPAQHYLGFTKGTVADRFAEHQAGTGSKICRAAAQRGIKMEVVWTTPGTRKDERKYKNRSNAKALCPKCRKKYLARRRKYDRQRRKNPKPVAHVGIQEVPL